jgi:hypothetical protein
MSGNEQVRAEMQSFLLALASYADRVARDPKVTFEQHHVSLMEPPVAGGWQPLAKAARSGN